MAKETVDFERHISQKNIDKYVMKGVLRLDEMGYEKLCKQCDEFWAMTSDFWYVQKGYPLMTHCWCKACYLEIRKKREGKR